MRGREPGECCYTLIVLSRSSAGGQETSNDESGAQQTKSMEAGRARSESDRATTCERRGLEGKAGSESKTRLALVWPGSGAAVPRDLDLRAGRGRGMEGQREKE